MSLIRVVAMAGSLRKGSYNRKLLAMAESVLSGLSVEVDHLDLRDFPLPLYDGDYEAEKGLPPEAWTLKAKLAAGHGVLIACPEYNGGIPGTFKNAIDWTSRGGSNPWAGKVVALMGATTGRWGTQRMMPQLRHTLQILNAIVIPQQVNVREAKKVWDPEGNLLDAKLPGVVEKVVKEWLCVMDLLRAGGKPDR